VALTTHPHLVPRLKKEKRYTSTTPWAFVAFSRVYFTGRIAFLFLATFFEFHFRKEINVDFRLSYPTSLPGVFV